MADNVDTTKYCPICNRTLPRSAFYNCKATIDGLLQRCKNCRRLKKLADRHANPEKARQIERARVRNKEPLRAAAKRWYAAHKAVAKQRIDAWNERNAEKRKATRDVWKAKNQDRLKEQDIAWRRANPEKSKLIRARYDAANRDKLREKRRRLIAKKPEAYRAARRLHRQLNIDRERATTANWRSNNHEKILAYKALRRARKKASPGFGWTEDDVKTRVTAQRGRCAYCKTQLTDKFHRDHIIPLAKGGLHDKRNLQLLCQPCNQTKSHRDPIDFARSLGLLL